jgi:hypothetical protein
MSGDGMPACGSRPVSLGRITRSAALGPRHGSAFGNRTHSCADPSNWWTSSATAPSVAFGATPSKPHCTVPPTSGTSSCGRSQSGRPTVSPSPTRNTSSATFASRPAPRDVMPLVPQATATRLLITNTTKLVAVAAELRKASDEKRRLLLVQADRLLDERQELRGR